jgi:hypothetical protein
MGGWGDYPAIEDRTAPGAMPSVQPATQANMTPENRRAHLRACGVHDTNTSDGYET